MDWVDTREEQIQEERSKGYFNIVEGPNQFVLLTHLAPLAQVYDLSTKKYRPAEEGDKNVSIKGVGWVLQDGLIKQAKLPYLVVKAIRGIQQDPEWDFKLPFAHMLTLTAKGAKKKEVEYTLTPSPKIVEIPQAILDELKTKQKPEHIVEKIKGGVAQNAPSEDTREAPVNYPVEDIDPADIPF